MYLGDPLTHTRVGNRDIKIVDPWRTGLLAAFVPGYAVYWWYRTGAELQALGRASDNDNVRLNPALMLVLVLLSGLVIPLIVAVVLLSEATKAAQRAQPTRSTASTGQNLALLVATWLTGPTALVLLALMGASAGAVIVGALLALLFSTALTLVLYEQLQHDLNQVWIARQADVSAPALVTA